MIFFPSYAQKSSAKMPAKGSSMELAMALSKSLQEAEEQEELRRAREMLENQEAFGWEATPSQVEMVVKAIAPDPPSIPEGNKYFIIGTL
jgi:hypothetical protein